VAACTVGESATAATCARIPFILPISLRLL
jgi:hypothetical protein